MALYESVFIARQDISSAQTEALTEQFSGIITENGGTASSSRGGLGLLAEFDDDELGGAQRREPDEDMHRLV